MSKEDKILRDLKQKRIPYECRVETITYEKVLKDGTKVTRTKTKVIDRPVPSHYEYPLKKQGYSFIIGNASFRDGISPRKNPRLTNNSPKFHNRIRRNGSVKRVQTRPISYQVLNKTAMTLIKEGHTSDLRNENGKIKSCYKKSLLKAVA